MKNPAGLTATVLLAAVAIAHLLRILFHVQVTAADAHIPMWVSGVAFLVSGGVAIALWRETRR